MKLKKITSILLVFLMVFTLMPFKNSAFAQEDSLGEFYSIIKSKLEAGKILENGKINGDAKAQMAVLYFNLEDNWTSSIQEAYSKDTASIKKLKDAGFTEDVIEKIIKEVVNVKEIENLNYNDKNAVVKYMENRYNTFYKLLPEKFIKNYDFSKLGKDNRAKFTLLLDITKKIYNSENLVCAKYLDNKLQNISLLVEDKYIDDANAKLSTEQKLTSNQIAIIKDLKNVISDVITKKINSNSKTQDAVIYLSKALGMLETKNETTPSGGGSGGGGGGGSTPTNNTPADTGNQVQGTLPKDAVEVKKEGNTTVATVKKEELTKVVQSVLDKLTANKEAVINIDLKDVKDLNAKISLPVEALKKLQGKEGSIVIKTDKLEVSIPIKSLDLGNENANIVLDTKEVSKEEVKNIVKGEIKSIAKVIELNLNKVDGNTITKIDSNFAKKVSVGIDISDVNVNKDNSVVVFVGNDTTQIVGAKVKGTKIYANLEHFSKYAVVERDIKFTDEENHWSKQNVESMAAKNIVNGYADNTFKPENKVTRAEFAKLLVNALEMDIVKGNEFNDMNNHWSKDYVNTAYKAGIIKGTDGKFNPDANITRAEMATMIGRALGNSTADAVSFNDSNIIPNWAKDSVAKAVKEQLIKGDNGFFRPNDNTSRAEAATVIYRLFNK